VAAIVAEEAFDPRRPGDAHHRGPASCNHVLEDWFMVDPEKIAEGIRKLAAY
jgi:hypothetical protein